MKGKATEKQKVYTNKEKREEERRREELKLNVSSRQIIIFLIEFMAVSVVFLCIWYYIGVTASSDDNS